MNLAQLLIDRAGRQPTAVAVVDDEGPVEYGELVAMAAGWARWFLSQRLEPGERVAFQLSNGRKWLGCYWGASLAALIAVPINTRNRPAEVDDMMARSGASLLVGESSETPEPAVLDDGVMARLGRGPDDVALLQFTSGSTARPKAAMLTHRGLTANARALTRVWGLDQGEALLVPSPLSHILGFVSGCLVPVLAGGTLLTMAAFRADRALELIDRYRPVGMAGTPTHYLMAVEHPHRARFDCSSLRFAMHGGGPMTPDVAARICADLGQPSLLSGFGMSETSGGVTSVDPDDPPDVQLATVGRPLPTFEVKIVDPADGSEKPDGEAGELWVRGIPVMTGYWEDPAESERALVGDGWLRTGDLMARGEDGCLRFAGRIKEMMIVGGYNVSPGEVERVLGGHPGVAEVAVVAAPHDRLGEIPIACVRLLPGAAATSETSRELEMFCRERLAGHKVPRHMVFVDDFPVSGSDKVERFKLRDRAAHLSAARDTTR